MSEDGDKSDPWQRVKNTVKPLKKGREARVSVPVRQAEKLPEKTQKLTISNRSDNSRPVPAQGSGIDRRTQERFRRGKLSFDARLDLHGMNRATAQVALTTFIAQNWTAQKRVLLVITGKGTRSAEPGGVLRQSFIEWLKLPEISGKILDYCPAQSKDGGQGAFYVLLRRDRNRKL